MASRRKTKQKKDPYVLIGQKKIDTISSFLILATLLMIGLYCRATLFEFYSPLMISGITSGPGMDIFTHDKWLILWLGTVILAILLIIKMFMFGYTIVENNINIPIILLVFWLALSCIFTDYYTASLVGAPDMYLGSAIYIFMIFLCFIAYNINLANRLGIPLIICLFIIAVANIIISVGDFYGVLWQYVPVVSNILLPSNVLPDMFTGAMKSTFSNPNYTSGLCGALAVFFLTIVALSTDLKQMVLCGLAGSVSLIDVLVQRSTTGFASFLAMSPIIIILIFLIKDRRKEKVFILSAFILITFGSGVLLNNHDPKIGQESLGWVKNALQSAAFKDSANSDTAQSEAVADNPGNINSSSTALDMWSAGVLQSPDQNRLFIAEETWKLIVQRPILGYGMDTMVYYFPQDSLETLAHLGPMQTLTKPHNMYLQVAYAAGLPALAFLLAILFMFIWQAGKKLYEGYKNNNNLATMPCAILFFIITFMIQGLVVDLTVGTGAIFWCMLGLGLASLQDKDKDLKADETSRRRSLKNAG